MKINLSILNSFRTGFLIMAIAVSQAFAGCSGAKSSASNGTAKAIRVLLVGGGSSHDFDRWYKGADVDILQRDGLSVVTYTSNTDSIKYYLPQTDVLYLSNNQPINDLQSRQAIVDFANAGKGILLAHAALWYNWKDWPEYNLQFAGGGSRGHDRYGEFQVDVVNTNHPITKGVEPKFTLKDERYYYIADPSGPGIEVLANNSVSGSDKVYPSIFVVKHPKTRIAAIALGHDAASHDLPVYQTLLRNAVKWVSGNN